MKPILRLYIIAISFILNFFLFAEVFDGYTLFTPKSAQEDGASTLMNTNTDIIRNNITISHDWNMENTWSFNHSLQYQVYSRKYLQIRPPEEGGNIEGNNLTSEDNIKYENMFHKKILHDS